MAKPIGTTARQLASLARWSLAVLVIVSMFAWWWPSLRAWGALLAGMGVVLLLWAMWKTVTGSRRIPGHPFHVALLGPILILAVHLLVSLSTEVGQSSQALAGGMLNSFIVVLSLIALGVLLSQSLLIRISDAPRFHSLLALAMMIGADTALIVPGSQPVHPAMTLLGLAGVFVWLAPLWPFRSPEAPEESNADENPHRPILVESPWLTRISWVGWLAVAAGQSILLLTSQLPMVLTAMLPAGAVFLVSGLLLHRRRGRYLLVGAGLLSAGAISILTWPPQLLMGPAIHAGPFGLGEQALKIVPATDSGWLVLGGFVGWVGLLWLLAGSLVCVVIMLAAVRAEAPDRQAGAVFWIAATVIGTAALFARAGLVVPAVIVAVSILWGALPAIADRARPARNGWWVFAWLSGLLLMVGLAVNNGLLGWIMRELTLSDKTVHFLLAIPATAVLAWLIGSRSVWWGLVGILLGASLGVAGEGLQMLFSHRGVEKADAIAHALGSAVVVLPYLLCMSARWSESPDARPAAHRSAGYAKPHGF